MIPDGYRRAVSALDSSAVRDILRAVAGRELDDLISTASSEALTSAVFSRFGFELLNDSEVRFHLLESLDENVLQGIAQRCEIADSGKRMDVALRLAALSWRHGAEVVDAIADQFELPDIMLPARRSTLSPLEEVEPHSPLDPMHDYQMEVCEAAVDALADSQHDAFLLQLPTGAGKTRVMMEALCSHRVRHSDRRGTVVWLAHTEELCDQAFESFVRTWAVRGDGVTTVARFWGEHRLGLNELGGNVVIGSYQKFAQFLTKEPLAATTLLREDCVLVVDEAHKALAPTIKPLVEVAKRADGCTAVGLTATPGRNADSSSENRQLAALFDGHLIYSRILGPDPIRRLQERKILAKVDRRALVSDSLIPGLDLAEEPTVATLTRLSKDTKRNQLIADAVAEQVRSGRQTLVFCCSVDHAERLALRCALGGVEAAHVDCRMRRYARRRTVDAFRSGGVKALFNYGVLSTGFDAPSVRCVLIARPTSSIVLYSQMVGRGLRGTLVGGSEDFVLIDVVDNEQAFGDLDGVYQHFADYWTSEVA